MSTGPQIASYPLGPGFAGTEVQHVEHATSASAAGGPNNRSLECQICHRVFSRRDALSRHHKVHKNRAPLQRFRACSKCAASRVRCSGEAPCTRCQSKSLSCVFPVGQFRSSNTATSVDRAQDDLLMRSDGPSEMASSVTGNDTTPAHAMLATPDAIEATDIMTTDVFPPSAMGNFFPREQHFPPQFMADDIETHMISDLNWLPTDFDFDMANFDVGFTSPQEAIWQPTVRSDGPTRGQAELQTPDNTAPRAQVDTPNDQAEGAYYVDDTGSRRPRNGRYASQSIQQEATPRSTVSNLTDIVPIHEPNDFYFSEEDVRFDTVQSPDSSLAADLLGQAEYQTILQAFRELCLSDHLPIGDVLFTSSNFPSLSFLNKSTQAYRSHFDPKALPMIHNKLHTNSQLQWIVKLAMAATGCQYIAIDDPQTSSTLHEVLRRIVNYHEKTFAQAEYCSPELLGIAQSRLLNYLFMAYSKSGKLGRWRDTTLRGVRADFIRLYNMERTMEKTMDTESNAQNWSLWIMHESLRRLCHCIFLADTMVCYHHDLPSAFLLEYTDLGLPCKETLWQARTFDAWKDSMQKTPTVEVALCVLYVEKRLVKGLGDFARVILIHGLYCQIWTIARSLDKPLLRWTPSARKEDAGAERLFRSPWLPGEPIYNRWRNATCDCLDVLHWIANSDIAKSGTENTTVQNLHFSRIVLLTPFDHIRKYARLLSSYNPEAHDLNKSKQAIQRWIFKDQYKARLALIHCGVLFWHLRRYSIDAFYEPMNVYMATLTVWAYGSLCKSMPFNNAQRPEQDDGDGASSSDVDAVDSIRLDRPTDDELVQMFIRKGHNMKATISGVGDITTGKGPTRMLKEGCRILTTFSGWSSRDSCLLELKALLQVGSGVMEGTLREGGT